MFMMTIMLLATCFGLVSGMVLFRRKILPQHSGKGVKDFSHKISVIIPARNEALNLPYLLETILAQSLQPDEVIVVDDHSEDNTRVVAEDYGVKVYASPDLPEGWTGKNWALWNGYLCSTGEILMFLDADVRLAPRALESLALTQKREGGVLSAVPYHYSTKFYEKFAMVANVLGVFAFTSPLEHANRKKGLYGACIVTSRRHYEQIGGHQSVRSEMLDDLNLGARFQDAGIPVTNYLGGHLVSFRMYPNGIKSELEGFSKGAVLSTSSLQILTLLLVILWLIGLLSSQLFVLALGSPFFLPALSAYLLYAVQFLYFNRDVGNFGTLHTIFHFLSTIFFLTVVGYSLYQAVVRKEVKWKGRYIHVGGGKS